MRTGEPPRHRPEAGFAYLLLLMAIAIVGIAAAASVILGASMTRRDAEVQLLTIGAEFEQALRSYAGMQAVSTDGQAIGRGPRSLDHLLKDPRVPGVRRHLRQLHADPLTGKNDWGVIKDDQGSIVAIHSLAEGRPIKQTGFDPSRVRFQEAQHYRQWLFGLP